MVEWKTLQEISNDEAYAALWNAGQSSTTNLYAMYNSLAWLSCHTDDERRQIAIAIRRDRNDDARVGIAVSFRRAVPLRFQFSRSREFAFDIDALELLGSEFIGDQGYDCVAEVIDSVWQTRRDVDAIYLKSVSNESPLWQTLAGNNWQLGRSAIYKPEGDRPFHYVALPSTYDEYMASFGSKQRFTLKKKIRKINEAFPGAVEVRRITAAGDLEFLTASARQVIARSWKAQELTRAVPESIENQRFLRAIADKGLLRSHVLLANGKACAFVVGYFYNGIYHYADLAYDTEYSDHSPGTVLLLMMIEDLIRQDQAKFINFGITDAQYKRVFGNRHVEDAALLILRPSLATGLRIGVHRGFREAKAFAKRILRK